MVVEQPATIVFVRLKLRLLVNGLRGQPWRVTLFVLGGLLGAVFAGLAYLIFALPGDAAAAATLLPLGGTMIVLGWLFLPLIFFGIDETLDPARFALLPLSRGTLIRGLAAGALTGVPALVTLVATLGMVQTAARLGGPGAALAEVVGVVLGLLLCVTASRAITSAFASALRSRRARDRATVLLAVVASLFGPAQLLVLAGAQQQDWGRVADVAAVLRWTPLGAPYAIGLGPPWAAPVRLIITVPAVAGLLWWWSSTLERAMLGGATAAGARRRRSGPAVKQLMVRFLPPTRFGALASREARYWWRESRRRASLITLSMIGVFLPVTLAATGGGTVGMLPVVGALAAIGLINQFGYDGSAYAANVVAGVPGRTELNARVAGYSIYVAPLLFTIAIVLGVVGGGRPGAVPSTLGLLAAAYGTGLAFVLPISVRGAYALPEAANPFALSTGGGMAKGLLSFAALFAGLIATLPLVVAAHLLGAVWLWVGLPAGLAYGAGAYLIGVGRAGRRLDHRMPELLSAITPTH